MSESDGLSDGPLTDTEYLRFCDLPKIGKTRRIIVLGVRRGDHLGDIRWFGRWRQYVFGPAPGTIFNVKCLASLADRLGHLNGMHRAGRGLPQGHRGGMATRGDIMSWARMVGRGGDALVALQEAADIANMVAMAADNGPAAPEPPGEEM